MSNGDPTRETTPTRFIIPAPDETMNERGILFYEASIGAPPPINSRVIATAVTERLDDMKFETVLSDSRADVTIGLVVHEDPSDVRLDLTINGQTTTLSGRTVGLGGSRRVAEPASCELSRPLALSENELAVIREWSRLGPSIRALVEATRQSWGCTACSFLAGGVAVSGGGCVGLAAALHPGAIGACGAALAGAGTFAEHCPGSCHHVVETAVHVMGGIGIDV